MTQFLARIVQLSPGEAASRVRAKVAIVERAMHQLTRPGLDPRAVQTAEQLLTDHAAPASLREWSCGARLPLPARRAVKIERRAAGIAAPRTEEKRAEA